MILVVGGCFQGKLEYGLSLLNEETGRDPEAAGERIADGETCTWEEALERPVLNHFHALIRRVMAAGETELLFPPETELPALMEALAASKQLILSDEIGNGIVPLDPIERRYRELTGRLCCRLAASASQVHRVVCGLGNRIK